MIGALNQMTGGQAPTAIAVATLIVTYVLAVTIRNSRKRRERASWGPRIGNYVGIIAQSWLYLVAVLVIVGCLVLRRPGDTFAAALHDMGLHAQLPPTDVAVWSMAMVAVATLLSSAVTYLRNALGGRPSVAGLDILPETPAETAVFSLLVAPTAGICEEVVYRGFLVGQLWILTNNPWLAAAIGSLFFGLAHLYQGWWGVFRTGVIGFVFAVGLIMTGSLIPSIIAHTLANMLGAAFRKPAAPQPAA